MSPSKAGVPDGSVLAMKIALFVDWRANTYLDGVVRILVEPSAVGHVRIPRKAQRQCDCIDRPLDRLHQGT